MHRYLVGLCLVSALMLTSVTGGRAEPQQEEDGMAFTRIDVPFAGAQSTVVTGWTPGNRPIGVYVDARGNLHGFLRRHADLFVPLLHTVPHDGAVVEGVVTITGFWTAPHADQPNTGIEGFVYADGTFERVRVSEPGRQIALITEALAINNAGQVVGDFRSSLDRRFHGFFYDPTVQPPQVTILDVPGAESTALVGLTHAGVLIGHTRDTSGVRSAFRYDIATQTFTTVTIPDLPEVDLAGITQSGKLAGNAGEVGFLYDPDTQAVTIVEFPGAQRTEVMGARDGARGSVRVWGAYVDAEDQTHGFTARIEGADGQTPKGRHRGQARPRMAKLQAPFRPEHCCPGSKRMVCRERS